MPLTREDIVAASRVAAEAMATAEADLNAADGHLGDGDTGQTMRRVAEAIRDAEVPQTDLGACFKALGMAAVSATGSSLGTLVAVGLMDLGKTLRDRQEVSVAEFADALESAEAVMLTRGRCALGDKTALDVLHAVRVSLQSDPANPHKARETAEATLETFRDRECRIGRARMYAERSKGMYDPGMLAFVRLTQALTGSQ